jgi:hypothetical protein
MMPDQRVLCWWMIWSVSLCAGTLATVEVYAAWLLRPSWLFGAAFWYLSATVILWADNRFFGDYA